MKTSSNQPSVWWRIPPPSARIDVSCCYYHKELNRMSFAPHDGQNKISFLCLGYWEGRSVSFVFCVRICWGKIRICESWICKRNKKGIRSCSNIISSACTAYVFVSTKYLSDRIKYIYVRTKNLLVRTKLICVTNLQQIC